jgi:hypothetical protein
VFVFKPKTNFSMESLAVFSGVSKMEAMDSNLELENSQKEKVRDFVDSVLVVDYVVPSPQALCFSLFHGWVSLSVSLISLSRLLERKGKKRMRKKKKKSRGENERKKRGRRT